MRLYLVPACWQMSYDGGFLDLSKSQKMVYFEKADAELKKPQDLSMEIKTHLSNSPALDSHQTPNGAVSADIEVFGR